MQNYSTFAKALKKADALFDSLPTGKRAILLLGPKNCGKTTLTYPLTQLPLKTVPSTQSYGQHYQAVQQFQTFSIRPTSDDKPILPNIKLIPKQADTYLIDLPQLFDQKDENRLIGYYYFLKVMKIFKQFKIILTVSMTALKLTCFYDCIEFLNLYFKSHKEAMWKGVWFCITKVDPGDTVLKVTQAMKECWSEWENILTLIKNAKQKDKIFLFYRPHQPPFEFEEFEPLLENQYWQIPETYKRYTDFRELRIEELLKASKECMESLQGVVNSCSKDFFEAVIQLIKNSEITSNELKDRINKIISRNAFYKFPQQPATLISEDNTKTAIPLIKSSLRKIKDLETLAAESQVILNIILENIELEEQECRMIFCLQHILKRKLIELSFVAFTSDTAIDFQEIQQKIDQVVGLKLFTIEVKKGPAEYYEKLIQNLRPIEQYEFEAIKQCFQNLISLAKSVQTQLKYNFQCLKFMKRVQPNSLQLITQYEIVAGLLLMNDNPLDAFELYKATFNYGKVLKLIQYIGMDSKGIVQIGDYFIKHGFIKGIEIYLLAMEHTHQISQKVEITNRILDAESNRESVMKKLRQRMNNKDFICSDIQLTDKLLEKKGFPGSRKIEAPNKILNVDKDLLDISDNLVKVGENLSRSYVLYS